MHEIISLRLENFLSFGVAEFSFEDAGFVLVEGRNGSGKSGMVDGVLWCLFGETLRGYRHDRVVHRKVGEGCLAVVRLRTNGKEWGVTRARKHKKLKNSLVIDDASGSGFVYASDKDAQDEIERRLGCSYKTFLSSVVFGQDRAYRFSSLTDAEQKKILDEVIGVERFAQACAVARKRASSVQGDLESNRRALEKTTKSRDEAEADAIDLQAKDADFAANQRKKIDAENAKLADVKRQLGKARRTHDAGALRKAHDAAVKELAATELAVDKVVAADASARSRVESVKARRDEASAKLKRHRKATDACPTCGQKVDPRRHAQVLNELSKEISALETELIDAQGKAEELAEELAGERGKLKAARDAVTAAQKAVAVAAASEGEVVSLKRRVADHEARVSELEAEENPYAALAARARSRHTQFSADADQLAACIEDDEAKLRRAEFWVKAYGASGLRSLLVDSSLPLLNEEAARVSRVLTGGAIKIEFSATTEQKSGKVVDRFEVRVDNKDGAGDYAGNSSGERAKVDLCVGLALQRLVASRSPAAFNLAVFDEVFDHLDAASHEPVIDVLSELDKDSVFVVSHDDDLKAWFPATLRIVKRGGFSAVEA